MNSPLVVLIILDGWGIALDSPGNAITRANTPNIHKFWSGYPHTTLTASGEAVGLPHGEAGNTETGHLNIGAGRIVYQDLLRINMSIADGSFFKNQVFLEAINHSIQNNSALHLMGLVGSGSVHSNIEHLYALLRLCQEQNFERVFLHLFTDGRDSPPNAAQTYIAQIGQYLKTLGIGKIASLMGRYWAMDRDQRWERTEKAYLALTKGVGKHYQSSQEAIEASYTAGVTDEFLNPSLICLGDIPVSLIKEGDAVIFYNFRIDRPRQLTAALVFEDLQKENDEQFDFDPYAVKYKKTHISPGVTNKVFDRAPKIKNLYFCSMTKYGNSIAKYAKIAFPPVNISQTLSEIISNKGLSQLKLAESEKERFVTFYFNGQNEIAFSQEEREIVPSKKIATYDLSPEMSAREITNALVAKLTDANSPQYTLIVVNYANADMVGHTGNIQATSAGVSILDECLGRIVQELDYKNAIVIITADHGNAEEMLDNEGKVNTEHTANPVPCIFVNREFLGKNETLQAGILADIAPTVLKLLGIPQPSEMTGRSLI